MISFRTISILASTFTSISASAGYIQYLGADKHLPAVVCGGSTGATVNMKDSLQDLGGLLGKLRSEMGLQDSDITISGLTHTVSSSPAMASVANCVLVSPRTVLAEQAKPRE